jgi:hypothetical protein
MWVAVATLMNPVCLCSMHSSASVANDSDVDCFRLGIVPENLVASLFDDDNAVSGITAEQQTPAAEPQKGFVTSDHPDAANWFYQDPQGVIQGSSCCKLIFFAFSETMFHFRYV